MGMAISGNAAAESSQKPGNGASRATKGDFLETFNVLPSGRFVTSETGLKVAVVKEGEGKAAEPGMRLKVHYTGWLEDGTQFDSSSVKGQPFEFVLGIGNVIKGWDEGLRDMKPGERRQLVIPANLAYGERQMGKIPPGATLVFNIEALAVESAAAANPNGRLSLMA
jgi:peptidylprolyl isomerase